jgi:hypothetical protein
VTGSTDSTFGGSGFASGFASGCAAGNATRSIGTDTTSSLGGDNVTTITIAAAMPNVAPYTID